ncbi:MAG: hypothetical protein Q9184_001357 [Pyrenodesmia sp. 2 TL-2023]
MAEYQQISDSRLSAGEDDAPPELDEPPDEKIHFSRIPPFTRPSVSKKAPMLHSRKASLLTQGLLTLPELTPSSDAEAPLLTSDGGLTSPARTNSPSPPLRASNPGDLPTITSHGLSTPRFKVHEKHPAFPPTTEAADSSPATDLVAGLGRKRCIKFACGRQASAKAEELYPAKGTTENYEATKPDNPPKRPCMLKFVCPIKTSSRAPERLQHPSAVTSKKNVTSSSSIVERAASTSRAENRQHRDSETIIRNTPMTVLSQGPDAASSGRKTVVFNRPDLESSEATRFHEFAGPYNGEDEWVNEQTAYRKKITVNDTLQKENEIRKLAEEAEEEALLEEEAEQETHDDLDGLSDDPSGVDGMSDGGNESDDEEGFAESDDESELGSDFHFWTPGLTTAATSADHLEHFRPTAPRTTSNSSIESTIRVKDAEKRPDYMAHCGRKGSRTKPVRMRPGTPDLPDSTDFVCGTLDEDRPLEAAYMSCLEERRRSKHPIVPQDIDPSFPTSDPEADEDSETKQASLHASDEPQWVMGQPDKSDEEQVAPRRKPLSRRTTRSPMPSPKRMRSPPPPRRSVARQAVLPHSASTATSEGSLSTSSSDVEGNTQQQMQRPSSALHTLTRRPKMMVPQMPRRATLTHTASLPRTPNPFWAPCRQRSRLSSAAISPASKAADVRSRGPIDIVTGLEKKRQRRKEKFWRQHCRNGVKENERRCQPGKGAERMRELGLEMAGKNKGYLPQVQLMLSI